MIFFMMKIEPYIWSEYLFEVSLLASPLFHLLQSQGAPSSDNSQWNPSHSGLFFSPQPKGLYKSKLTTSIFHYNKFKNYLNAFFPDETAQILHINGTYVVLPIIHFKITKLKMDYVIHALQFYKLLHWISYTLLLRLLKPELSALSWPTSQSSSVSCSPAYRGLSTIHSHWWTFVQSHTGINCQHKETH